MSERKLEVYNILNFLNSGYDLDYILKESNWVTFSSDDECINYLVSEGYLLDESGEKENSVLTFDDLKEHTIPQLKDLLREHNLKVSGKKHELINRLLAVLNESKTQSLDDFAVSNDYKLTEKALKFLKDDQWIDLYTFALINFRFEDYETYVSNSSKDMITTALNFCDEVISRSLINNYFLLFLTALSAKAHVYAYDGDYESFLDYDLQRFILGLNPIVLDAGAYANYVIIEPANVINIKNVSEKFNFGRLKNRFDKLWVKSNIKNVTVPKKTAFKYLKRAMGGANLDDLNFELREKYFNKKFGE